MTDTETQKPVIALGADHGGFNDKQRLAKRLREQGYRIIDAGTNSDAAADYPIFAFRVAQAVGRGEAQFGILLCRSGNGMAIAANKVHGVRAAIANTAKLAELARSHNDANVLVMGSDHMDTNPETVLEAFLKAQPEDGRHARRVDMIKNYDATAASKLATHQLLAHGQSPWLDDISDMLLESGEMKRMIENEGLRGVTSNPSIFEKAINSGEGRYRTELAEMKKAGVSPQDAYEKLTTDDIRAAADLLRPIYDETGGDDGYVSLELLPSLAYEEDTSVSEAKRLFEAVDRPNVMIKIPGTKEGIRAFRRALAAGVNVNVTLIFSIEFYRDIARAYMEGLRDRLNNGEDISKVRSVASVFVSRIDGETNKRLEEAKLTETDTSKHKKIDDLMHKAGIANTRLIYAEFKKLFQGEEFADLAAAGAAVQRPLWGSTSTKDPSLPDTLYVEELVGPQTVNTIPKKTWEALVDHGKIRGNTVEENVDRAARTIEALSELGIEIEDVCMTLQKAGVKAFADSFDKLFDAIKKALA